MKFVCDIRNLEAGTIGNRFSNLSFWSFNGTTSDERMWSEWAEAMPEGWLKATYPWLEEMQIFVASGGAYIGHPRQSGDAAPCEFTRDLFKDPADRSVLDDYEFEPLVSACRNMQRQGVRPCLKLHAVPLKYSSQPKISWFRINCRPPDDYEVYAGYISALAQSMVDAFGQDEVCRWRWFVGTEMENPMWWEAKDESAESTMREYLKFHDWSVFGLERVLGEACGPVGAHAMMSGEYTGGLWNPEAFMEHCARGANHATDETGSRLDFFAISYYDRAPGRLESDEWQTNLTGEGGDLALFEEFVGRTRTALDRCGFKGLPIEVSEGGMLFGMDGKWMWHGMSPGGMFDATWTVWAFWKMLESDVTLWSRWPLLRTRGLFHGPEATSTHAVRMLTTMKKDRRIAVTQPDDDRLVRVIGSISPKSDTVRLLVFHHAADVTRPIDAAELEMELRNLPFEGTVRVTKRAIDRSHGDFWPQWEKDRTRLGITDEDYFRSRDQFDVAHALINPLHKEIWAHYEKQMEPLAAYPEAEAQLLEARNHTLLLRPEVPCFSLSLYEITATHV